MTTLGTFRQGLLDPTVETPSGLKSAAEGPAGKRYDVYRNNVTHSLIEALGTAFPLVRKILGAQRFDALAPQFVRAHPPASPLLMHYGFDFPAFLAKAPDVAKLGYLPDCARLDLGLRASYHASDATRFDLAAFHRLPPDQMMQQQLKLAPSSHVLRSRWPLYDIWRFNMGKDAPKPRAEAQDILITRPQFDPELNLLPIGAADWLDGLELGNSIAAAYDAVAALHPEFDLEGTLTLAFAHHAFCDLKVGQHADN